jgi:hypothetical protein
LADDSLMKKERSSSPMIESDTSTEAEDEAEEGNKRGSASDERKGGKMI